MNNKRKSEGCKICTVGVYYGLQVSGYYTAHCRSALLGLDDNLNYQTRSIRLKGREKYPEWCPLKDKAEKGGKVMIFECRRMKGRIDELIGRSRTVVTEDFLSVLPPDSKLYQAYFMGSKENSTVENVTSELLDIFLLLTDTELTKLLEISRSLLEKANAQSNEK